MTCWWILSREHSRCLEIILLICRGGFFKSFRIIPGFISENTGIHFSFLAPQHLERWEGELNSSLSCYFPTCFTGSCPFKSGKKNSYLWTKQRKSRTAVAQKGPEGIAYHLTRVCLVSLRNHLLAADGPVVWPTRTLNADVSTDTFTARAPAVEEHSPNSGALRGLEWQPA